MLVTPISIVFNTVFKTYFPATRVLELTPLKGLCPIYNQVIKVI